ncbi:hypothetical protein BT96DRAFT_938357 [Gymnopus androsaceus JB14]|uniref:Uncharacterized protein n=1 Tax=Gymnopus androsaceus JB14 TaxID=1447944 RepID=A0A6A4HPH6_9AGAR|nr:hypothetical protein BT96DRAFT_938357 [Gymnopus androsaceus JB14]
MQIFFQMVHSKPHSKFSHSHNLNPKVHNKEGRPKPTIIQLSLSMYPFLIGGLWTQILTPEGDEDKAVVMVMAQHRVKTVVVVVHQVKHYMFPLMLSPEHLQGHDMVSQFTLILEAQVKHLTSLGSRQMVLTHTLHLYLIRLVKTHKPHKLSSKAPPNKALQYAPLDLQGTHPLIVLQQSAALHSIMPHLHIHALELEREEDVMLLMSGHFLLGTDLKDYFKVLISK